MHIFKFHANSTRVPAASLMVSNSVNITRQSYNAYCCNLGRAIKADNPQTALWTVLTTAGVTGVAVVGYFLKKIIDRKMDKKKTGDDAETDNSEKSQKGGLATTDKNESVSTPGLDTPASGINLQGCSAEELFNRVPIENSKWVVDGYMKVGLINLLVAGGGVGKSILMVQIALAVAYGIRPEFLPSDSSASAKLPVVFYRMEDFPGEFEGKYGDGSALRNSGIRWFLPKDLPLSDLTGFIVHLKKFAETLKEDTLVCIDPATKLPGYRHSEFITGVEDAMATAKVHNITLTVLASIHLDEIKDWTVLTNCDIKGGDMALQQAGSVTALRRERTDVEKFRYLQCLKEPKGSPKPFNGKVPVCKLVGYEPEGRKHLHLEYDSTKSEQKARPLKPKAEGSGSTHEENTAERSAPNQKVTPEIKKRIMDLSAEGKSVKFIAKKLRLSERTIRRNKKG